MHYAKLKMTHKYKWMNIIDRMCNTGINHFVTEDYTHSNVTHTHAHTHTLCDILSLLSMHNTKS